MFKYKCECGKGTIKEEIRENYEVVMKGSPFIIPEAHIGVCDACGVINYHGKEMRRWTKLYELETGKAKA